MTTAQMIFSGIGIVISVGGVIIGIIIGFYKCKADLSEQYVSKNDCQTCSVKNEMAVISRDMKEASQELKKGSQTFTEIKVSMAVLVEELQMKDKVKSMLESMRLKNQ